MPPLFEDKSLGDGRLHVSTRPSVLGVQLDQSAVLPVHDEVPSFTTFGRDVYKIIIINTATLGKGILQSPCSVKTVCRRPEARTSEEWQARPKVNNSVAMMWVSAES